MANLSTTYPILNPFETIDRAVRSRRSTQCALAVMAKAPRPGKVKTRLAPPLTLDQTAALNICFLRDTTTHIAEVASSGKAEGLVSYTPVGDEALFNDILPSTFSLVPQRGDGFGERLLCAAQDILALGFGSVCLIDSDSPTVPATAFRDAIAALARPGDRVVLGATHDGGYYLIGLKKPHPEPFTNISWSTATVAAETRDRCYAAHFDVVNLPLWYDVDDQYSLTLLSSELLHNIQPHFATAVGYPAPHTLAFLREMIKQPSEKP